MVREKDHVMYKGRVMIIIADFSAETMKAQSDWTSVHNHRTPRMSQQL